MPALMVRVGHKGADALVAGNTRASFDAALECGVDMIEFDVLPESGTGRLVMAHDPGDARSRPVETLEQGLAHLAASDAELDVDLKAPGYELRVLEALREHGLVERSLVSSQHRTSLALLRSAEPALRLGWSVPKVRRDPFRSRATTVPAVAVLLAYREALPARAAGALRAGEVDAVMAHWRLVTPRLAKAVRSAGGALYVWTVDEPALLERMARLGADGVITNDPRLFTRSSSVRH